MGRVGSGAYDTVRQHLGDIVLGVDMDAETVEKLKAGGRRAMLGSATDPDYWDRVSLDSDRVKLILLAMPGYQENLFAAEQLKQRGYTGKIAAVAKYPDEMEALLQAGVDRAYNLYAEAGAGFAEDVCGELLPENAG